MNQFKYLNVYAVLIILTGAVLMILAYIPGIAIKYCVSAGMALSALFAFLTAYKSRGLPQPLRYHILHAIGMLVYSAAILLWGYDVQHFFSITVLFLFYYGIAEMLFCVQLAALEKYVSIKVVLGRLIMGLLIAIGAILMFFTISVNTNTTLAIGGFVLAASGCSLLHFKTALVKHIAKKKPYTMLTDKMHRDYFSLDMAALKSGKWTIGNRRIKFGRN
jgi:hypothetical protein